MKKLMIAAAAAAVSVGVLAATESQVYDFTATLKTTTCKATKVSSALAKYFDKDGVSQDAGVFSKGDEISLRKQATRKLQGVIWGCNCPTIENPKWAKYNNGRYIGGYAFWVPTANDGDGDYLRFRRTRFFWNVLNRIDAMTKAEGAFTLISRTPGLRVYLTGAGFGKVKNTGCGTILSSISGNLSGFRQPDVDSSCIFCTAEGCIVEPLCDVCSDANSKASTTVAYGTWKIKYNSSASKKLAKTPFLSQVYKFKKAGNLPQNLSIVEALAFRGIIDRVTEDDGEAFDIDAIGDIDPEEVEDASLKSKIATLIADEGDDALDESETEADEEFDAAFDEIIEQIAEIAGAEGGEEEGGDAS